MAGHNTLDPIEGIIASNRPSRRAYPAMLIIGLLTSGIIWAFLGNLDEVAVASGEIVPQGQVKVIQHLEGGIVSSIHVEEGQHVTPGMPLIQLRLGADRVNSEGLKLRLNGFLIKGERLQAELNGKDFNLSAIKGKRVKNIILKELSSFENRKKQILANKEILNTRARQKRLEIKELESRLQGRKNSLALSKQRLEILKKLAKDKLVTRMEILDHEKEYEELRSEISELENSLQRSREALDEARQRSKFQMLDFKRDVSEELGKVEIAIAQIREQMETAAEIVRQTSIKSPIEGIVKNLQQHTIGGIVQPGDAMMEIVPSRDQLVVETKLAPIDVGYVRVGQNAEVRMQTYDFLRYGALKGIVKNVAADSSVGSDGGTYFRVVIKTEKNYLGKKAGSLPITPGMQADVNIRTGTRSVLSYLVSPVLKLRHTAFQER